MWKLDEYVGKKPIKNSNLLVVARRQTDDNCIALEVREKYVGRIVLLHGWQPYNTYSILSIHDTVEDLIEEENYYKELIEQENNFDDQHSSEK
jgi:hypothetical protein